MKKMLVGILSLILITGAGCSWFSKQDPNNSPSSTTENTSQRFPYTVLGLKFQSPAELPQLFDIGASKNTAYSIGILGKNNQQDFEIIFYVVPEGLKKDMDQKQVLAYGKSTFLANGEAGKEEVTKTFFNKSVVGEKQSTTIPSDGTIESYLVELPSGKWLFLGTRYNDTFPKEKADTIMNVVASTLQE